MKTRTNIENQKAVSSKQTAEGLAVCCLLLTAYCFLARYPGRLWRTVNRLSDSQAAALRTLASGESMGQLVKCATGSNLELASTNTVSIDPRTDNLAVRDLWGIAGAGEGYYNTFALFYLF